MLSFMTNHCKQSKQERGSIMLEVIAVLALMGVMGAMLFRQIYQRNQELHNIQMASEIRTVKEAFSAYIQSDRSNLLTQCGPTDTDGNYCNISSSDLADAVDTYLPNGWFEGDSLNDAYTFSLWTILENDTTKKQIMYGLIVPKGDSLPQTGWNFKRAARVALLVGADGGVYKHSMSNDVNGVLGTWVLTADVAHMGLPADEQSVYVARTGMDIFTPEYDLPESKTAFQRNLELGMDKLHAWDYFAAGGPVGGSRETCFTVSHNIAEESGGSVLVHNDSITMPPGCQPLFYVKRDDSGKGLVFVNSDLNVGKDGTSNVKIRQEGPIVFNATDQDAQKSNNNTAYLLDPQYTSVMNDVKIMSRGGARLSDILPDYILKKVEQKEFKHGSNKQTVDVPVCPNGYRAAIVVTPFTWDQSLTAPAGGNANVSITGGSIPVSNATINKDSIKIDVKDNVVNNNVSAKNDVTISGQTVTASATNKLTGTADLSALSVTEGVCVSIKFDSGSYSNSKGTLESDASTSTSAPGLKKWTVAMNYKNDDGQCSNDMPTGMNLHAIIQTYCVWQDAITKPANKDRKQDAASWSTFKDKITTQEECRSYGGTWTAANKCE